MAAPSTKQRYSIHIVLSQRINHNESYRDLGKLLVAIASNVTLKEFIAAAKKKIDKKYGKKYAFNYEEQQGLQLFVRPKQDENIKSMKHKWSEIVDFDEAVNDYILQPNDEVVVFLFTEAKQSSPMPVPLDPVPPPSAHVMRPKALSSSPKNTSHKPMAISKMHYHDYTVIKNAVDAKFYKIRVRYFEQQTFRINEMVKEFPRDVTIGDVKKELSCISGIHARLQNKPIPNIIDSDKCICFAIKLQAQMLKPKAKEASNIKAIKCDDDNMLCGICRNKLNSLCIECQADPLAFGAPTPKTDCTIAGSTGCEHTYHSHCVHRWLKTRDTCPMDNKAWAFAMNDDANKGNDDDKQNDDDEPPPESIHFYYKRLNGGQLEHIELTKKQHGIDFKLLSVNDLCNELRAMVNGLEFNDKRLFANQVNVTFKREMKLHEVGFEGEDNILHICGRKKHEHSLTLEVHHVRMVYPQIHGDDDDEKKQNDPNEEDAADSARDDGTSVITYETTRMGGVSSSLSMTDLKKKIELIMDIAEDKQTLFHKTIDGEYDLIENDTQIAEIGDVLCGNLNIFVSSESAHIDCTFDMFCNGYLLASRDHKRALFSIFSPFYEENGSAHNGCDVLYCAPRWLYRKGAFIKKSILNSEALYQSCGVNDTIPDTLRLSAAWIPFIPQTRKGMTSFLSCLYVITQCNIADKRGVLCMIRCLTLNRFAPLLLSFKILLDRRLLQLTREHKSALSNGFYYLFRLMVPQKVCPDDSKIFQYSHLLFSYILGNSAQYDDKYKQYEKYKVKQLTDPLSNARLIDPVRVTRRVVAAAAETLKVFVKRLSGKTMVICGLKSSDRVLKLQELIAADESDGVAVAKQKLIFCGKELKSTQLLSKCKIVNECNVHLVERMEVVEEEDEEDEEEEEQIYSRQSIDKLDDIASVEPATQTAQLLESYGSSNEVYIWDWKRLTECIDYKENNSELNLNWAEITSSIGNNESNKMMKIIPTLSLKNLSSSSTVLSLDVHGNLCALCGAVKNDGNNRKFYLPLYRDLYSVDLDELALQIKNLNLNIDADSWVDLVDADAIDDRQPLEAIVVCFDRSYSMQEACFSDEEEEEEAMSRLDVVKCYWSAFLNRSKAYDYANHIGLIVFDSSVETSCHLSPLYERFRKRVEEVEVRGCTALRDAMKEACKQLMEWKLRDHKKRSKCNLRIIALTDGEDNQSSISDVNLTQILLRHGITADAIMIGNHNHSLHAICSATGGYVFYPLTFRDGLRIFELETFLSMAERPARSTTRINNICSQQELNKYGETSVDICDENHAPPGRQIEMIQKPTQSLEKAIGKNQNQNNQKLRSRKVIREMSSIMRDPHPFWDIYVQDENIFFWKLVLEGPNDTPYEGAVFLLYLELGNDYPDRAPKMRFITPIKHVNVNSYGRICHSIFDRNYAPDTKIRDILNNVYGLLLHPDWDDPLDSVLRQEYADDKHAFATSVQKHVEMHAKAKTREQWKNELDGGDDDNDVDMAWIPHNKDNQMDDDIV
eukprot:694066_1